MSTAALAFTSTGIEPSSADIDVGLYAVGKLDPVLVKYVRAKRPSGRQTGRHKHKKKKK
ncbi:MAG: hypothetical protein K6F09_09815 [Clostridiales bacterium]|nr:hypothetical protein [Clostridiales bacterium]